MWNKINLKDIDSYMGSVKEMMSTEPGDGKISDRTIFTFLDIDYETEQQQLKEEAIDSIARKKELERLGKMSLEELKTIDPTKPVKDLHPEEIAEDGGNEGNDGNNGGDEGMGGLAGLGDLGDLGGEDEASAGEE